MSGTGAPMPFDFSELFTAGVREMLPRLQAKRLAFAFDCHGPQLTLPGDPVAMRCSMHRLLSGLVDLIDVGFLVFDAETGASASGGSVARVRLAGTGLFAGPERMSEVLQRLGLTETRVVHAEITGTRFASGRCPRTDAPVQFARLGKDGLIFRAEWADAQAERWEIARAVDAHGAPAWVINERPVGGRSLERRLQRLGWAPRIFASVEQARQALRAAPEDTLPALLVAVESASITAAALDGLAAQLPPGTQCLHAVASGSPALSSGEPAAGFELRVYPLSPWELHQITERLCQQRRAPLGQTLPYPVVQEERPRLLVVDDNPLTRMLARSLGEGLGYEVASVPDGVAALQSCERWAPDVVLMDVRMKPWSGLETTQRLRELQREGAVAPCAVVALTADDSESTRRACFAAGMDGHLAKPIMLSSLAAELSRVCIGHGRQTDGTRYLPRAGALTPRPQASAAEPAAGTIDALLRTGRFPFPRG